MREHQRPFLAVALAFHHHKRGEKTDHLKVLGELLGIPHGAVLGFKGGPSLGLGVDFGGACLACSLSDGTERSGGQIC